MVKIKFCRKSSFKFSDLWVTSHDKLSDFYASSWQRGDSPVPLLLVRVIALVIALCILFWAVTEGCNVYWLIFLTNWGLMLVATMFLSGVIVSVAAMCKKLPEEGEMPWYVSVYWLLHNLAISVSLLITALYWILLYNPETQDMIGTRLFVLDLVTHGVNSVLVMVELLVSRTPVYIVHVYQPLGVGIWYAVFTLIYYLAGGTNGNGLPYIYDVLDWREGARSGVIVTISAIALVTIYCVVYALALCRDKLTGLMFRTTSMKLAYVPPDISTLPGAEDYV